MTKTAFKLSWSSLLSSFNICNFCKFSCFNFSCSGLFCYHTCKCTCFNTPFRSVQLNICNPAKTMFKYILYIFCSLFGAYVPISSVSKRLGHSDIQTTLNHYSHVLKEMEERDEELAINVYSS